MEWLLLPAAAALAWYLGKRNGSPSSEPPPDTLPSESIKSARIYVEWTHSVAIIPIPITQKTFYHDFKLGQTEGFILPQAVCGFRGEGRVESDGSYLLIGENMRQYRGVNVRWSGVLKRGDNIVLAENGYYLGGGNIGIGEKAKIFISAL